MIKTLSVLFCLLSWGASADHLRMVIEADGWAPKLRVVCEGTDCETIRIEREWNGRIELQTDAVPISRLIELVEGMQFPKHYVTHEILDLGFDPHAGVLNIFVPFLWVVGGTACLVADFKELVTDAKPRIVATVKKAAESLRTSTEVQTIKMRHGDFGKLYRAFELYGKDVPCDRQISL